MPTYKVRIPPSVITELEDNFDYIAKDSITNAIRWYRNIRKKILSLQENPGRCPIAIESRYRSYEIRHLIVRPYRVLFRIQGDIVELLHVRHGNRKRELP